MSENITDFETPEDIRSMSADEELEALHDRLESMGKQRLEKMANAQSHLGGRLDVMKDQWRTANGLLNAMKAMREIDESLDLTAEIDMAKKIASGMSFYIDDFRKDVLAMSLEDFSEECGELLESRRMFDADFIGHHRNIGMYEFATELLRLNFCSSVGSSLEDCADFYKSSGEEMERVKDRIRQIEDGEAEADEKVGNAKHKA